MSAPRCCSRCKTPFQVCALQRTCRCHRVEEAQFNAPRDLLSAIADQRTTEARFNRDRRKA